VDNELFYTERKRGEGATMTNNTGIPDDEFILAQLIQNAEYFGLKSCRGATFKRNGAISCPSEATHCCAMGANFLSLTGASAWLNVGAGNDSTLHYKPSVWANGSHKDGYTLGQAFYAALKD
jgi:hypothetical protein